MRLRRTERTTLPMKKQNKKKLFTVGEIYRGKMLINRHGKPYSAVAAVLSVVRLLPHKRVKTPFGIGYGVALSTIEAHNKKMRATMSA